MDEIKRPILKPYSKDRFELMADYEYGNIQIPAGFKTNGANIPRIFWSIYPPNSPEYLSAVLVHDYLCDEAKTKRAYLRADLLFRKMLLALNIRRSKVWIFFICVRIYHLIKHAGLEWEDRTKGLVNERF